MQKSVKINKKLLDLNVRFSATAKSIMLRHLSSSVMLRRDRRVQVKQYSYIISWIPVSIPRG